MSEIKLMQGDCLELMKDIPDKSVDMVLCDLPYGCLNKSNVNARWDSIIPFKSLWEQYNRIIKDNGVILLFGQSLFYVDMVNSNKKMFRYDLVWNKVLKSGFLNAKCMPLRQHEQIAVFYKHLPTYNPQMTQGKPLHSKGSAYKNKNSTNNNYGKIGITDDSRSGCTDKYPTSIVTYSKSHPSVAQHPTEKPIELLEYLIKTYTNENDIVLDNCMGSGSTGVACVNTNRNFIGIELDENYFNIAKERIEKARENK